MEPVMKPLGFDWKMSISLLSGLAAKEVVVSTMAVLYQIDPNSDDNKGLAEKLREDTTSTYKQAGIYTRVSALSFMIFILIYSPCVAVVAAIGKESGSWKWAVFTVFYTTALAWISAYLVFELGSLIM
ncbi:MAG: hypothetical protein HC905_30215 [Bacteroidales bacterium]|nr:hypothetical protein [Bacteroidales bacterium]